MERNFLRSVNHSASIPRFDVPSRVDPAGGSVAPAVLAAARSASLVDGPYTIEVVRGSRVTDATLGGVGV